jgi:hypothetical protein
MQSRRTLTRKSQPDASGGLFGNCNFEGLNEADIAAGGARSRDWPPVSEDLGVATHTQTGGFPMAEIS